MSVAIKQIVKTCSSQPFYIQIRNSRSNPFVPVMKKKYSPQLFYSLKERLAEKDEKLKDPEMYAKVNIGYSVPNQKKSSIERKKIIQSLKQDKNLEKQARDCTLEIDLDVVEKDWIASSKPDQIKALAENSDIFKHLFGDFAYFYPIVNMQIHYDYDEESLSPVFAGNLLKPKETATKPNIKFESQPNDLWTIIMTNPDGNLFDNDSEMIHWFLGNVPGGVISEGEQVIEYMRPMPPKGTGFHRYCFVLYKQESRIDYSNYRREGPCLKLRDRTFKTTEFYREFENVLTPTGLAWFNADYDSSLTEFFYKTLKMKEPHFEYEFPKPYIAPQVMFPMQKPFNRYMDLHRDPKETQKLMLLKRLARVHPFQGEKPLLPFPQAVPIQNDLPIWLKNEIRYSRDGEGKYRDMYRGDDRPHIPDKKDKKYPYYNINI